MKIWFKNRKGHRIILLIMIFIGLGIFGYYTYQQQRFNDITREKQNIALKLLKRKERERTYSKGKLGISSKTHNFTIDAQKVDYIGKDVTPLSLSIMTGVNVEKIVYSFGAGVLEIPSIGMAVPILEGISQSNLSVGAGTMKAGQELKKRNFALAGHYMTKLGLLFGGIRRIQKNDLIVVTYLNEQAIYQVVEAKIISKNDGYVISDSEGDGILTLVTCDRAVEGTPNRFMVRARLVER